MSKQRDFLDKLMDPTKVLIKEAIQYFLDRNENMRAEYMLEIKAGYVVDLLASSLEEMNCAASDFVITLEKFLNNSNIHIRASWGDDPLPYSYRRSYFITKP